jgi:hypothetical protein
MKLYVVAERKNQSVGLMLTKLKLQLKDPHRNLVEGQLAKGLQAPLEGKIFF